MLRTSIAALSVAIITVLATPVAAFAAPDADSPSCSGVSPDYATSGSVTADRSTMGGGDTVTVSWQNHYFAPDSAVTVSSSGSGAVGSEFASTGVADANGDLTMRVTAATDAVGSLVVSGSSECATGGVTVTVLGPAATTAASDPTLAFTGSTVPVVLIVTGGGALAFGGILLAARARSRRRTQQ